MLLGHRRRFFSGLHASAARRRGEERRGSPLFRRGSGLARRRILLQRPGVQEGHSPDPSLVRAPWSCGAVLFVDALVGFREEGSGRKGVRFFGFSPHSMPHSSAAFVFRRLTRACAAFWRSSCG